MRFHLLGFPHTATSKLFCACAYTQKVLKFAAMMAPRGHELIHYGLEGSTIDCEHVEVMSLKDRERFFGPVNPDAPVAELGWELSQPYWRIFMQRAAARMRGRVRPRDFILTLAGGNLTSPVVQAFPDNMVVEYGIGYYGTFSQYRVYESEIFREWHHGRVNSTMENYKDAVIPNYFDVRDFPYDPHAKRDGYLFVGRIVNSKGWGVAVQATERIGAKLILAGHQGDPGKLPPHVTFVGHVGMEERAKLMNGVLATFAPTAYREPFGGVAVEAQLLGTPCITTDHGAFVETVESRWRCANMREFVAAAEEAKTLTRKDRSALRDRAVGRYSLEAVAPLYERYFNRLYDLWGTGYYEESPLYDREHPVALPQAANC
jgi:glycosyltransferase involved in cell wall biosynthesis